MAAPRLFKTEGIVLKVAPYGEADLIVTLVSQDGSKLRAMAWGARKMNSRKMGHLDTLTRVDLDLYRGPSMYSIRQVLNLESFVSSRAVWTPPPAPSTSPSLWTVSPSKPAPTPLSTTCFWKPCDGCRTPRKTTNQF